MYYDVIYNFFYDRKCNSISVINAQLLFKKKTKQTHINKFTVNIDNIVQYSIYIDNS